MVTLQRVVFLYNRSVLETRCRNGYACNTPLARNRKTSHWINDLLFYLVFNSGLQRVLGIQHAGQQRDIATFSFFEILTNRVLLPLQTFNCARGHECVVTRVFLVLSEHWFLRGYKTVGLYLQRSSIILFTRNV